MGERSILVEDLGKEYVLGERHQTYQTLRDTLARAARAPVARMRSRERRPESERMWALRHVDLEVWEGDAVGLVGANGAGKSTLLKILSRITEPTEGRATIWGRLGSLLEVGTGFHSELTGRENIFLNGSLLGMKRAEIRRRFDEIVEFSEIARFLDTPVKHYSSGMRVRLGFAVAAHLSLDVLLVDEVLAVGDAAFQRKCLGKMGDVASQGRTVFLVSHNMTAISRLCSRAILVTEGRVALDGRPGEVILRYLEQAAESTGERRWSDLRDAPGNDEARICAVRLRSNGETTSTVDIDKDAYIDVEFFLGNRGNRSLAVVVYLLDSAGTTVLSTLNSTHANLETDEWFGSDHSAGYYQATCAIPGNFLNDIRYYVTVYLVTLDTLTIEATADQAIAFDVFDTGVMRDNSGDWHGVVRPRLAWRTSELEHSGAAAERAWLPQ